MSQCLYPIICMSQFQDLLESSTKPQKINSVSATIDFLRLYISGLGRNRVTNNDNKHFPLNYLLKHIFRCNIRTDENRLLSTSGLHVRLISQAVFGLTFSDSS